VRPVHGCAELNVDVPTNMTDIDIISFAGVWLLPYCQNLLLHLIPTSLDIHILAHFRHVMCLLLLVRYKMVVMCRTRFLQSKSHEWP
jgi:hypothetical protein